MHSATKAITMKNYQLSELIYIYLVLILCIS